MVTLSKKERLEQIIIPTPFAVGDVNVYLLMGDAVSLVDVGPNTPEAWVALERGLAAHGLTPGDIDQILLTHHHIDHYGLASRIQEIKGARLYCHPLSEMFVRRDEEKLKRAVDYFEQLYLLHGVPERVASQAIGHKKLYDDFGSTAEIHGWLKGGEGLPGHEEWEIYHMPGHSQDHLCFYERDQKILLGGDHLIKHISSNAILEAPQADVERPKTLIQYRDSLKKCLRMDIEKVYSGHGEPIEEVSSLIENRLERQEQRADAILDLMQRGEKTAWEISIAMFGERLKEEMSLILSEVIGHLDLLLEQGRVQTIQRDQRLYYQG
ncbi:MBL fold metallo-hydrolase [Ammoniphilus sp. YIM 78166]|uniref:MBL fold metallo-hydrolase n=1 Tax=Ammoniphilus sp. YIM 78166 TaxID=1644106 RepID=UPI0010706829|nr:MBL fold metallo-hydrolase [Ammoniphilus sp. YIM 78166]